MCRSKSLVGAAVVLAIGLHGAAQTAAPRGDQVIPEGDCAVGKLGTAISPSAIGEPVA